MDSVYGMPGAAGGRGWHLLSTGRADSVLAEPEPAGLLPVWLHGHIAESIHCQHLNNVAFSGVAFSFPCRSAVNEKGCQSLSG